LFLLVGGVAMKVLEISGLYKSYKLKLNEVPVLRGIDLDIEEGSFVSILGRSGSGKTTLLNVISTLLNFEKGEIILDGHDITRLSIRELNCVRNNTIGFVFQEFNLVNDITVIDNVATPLILNGVNFAEARKKAFEVLKQVGLEEYAKVRPVELSGGQQQRVAIARAIVNDQKIILCDEPTGALDDYTAVEILELLRELSKTKTIIMVTHDEEFAKIYSDRLIMLVDGVIVKDQELHKIENKNIDAGVIRFKKMGITNLFRYSFLSMDVDKKRFKKTFRTFSLSLMLFMVLNSISQNLMMFTNRYLQVFVNSELSNRNFILDIVYQFLEQNITQFVQAILYILLGFCMMSYLFVFTINIMNKKREIAVLKALGASQKDISLLFMMRPLKFTVTIFKDALLYSLIAILLINGIFNIHSIIIADYATFFTNMFRVFFSVIGSFILHKPVGGISFPLYIAQVVSLYLVVSILFMVGSLVPAIKISRSHTLRMLARE